MARDPGAVDGTSVVSRVAGVHVLPLTDDRLLLHDVASGSLLVVNPTGALVWECLDGSSSVAEVCRDLADVLGASFETVLTDTCAVIRQMAERGLVSEAEDYSADREFLARVTARDLAPTARREFDEDPWGAIGARAGGQLLGLGVGDQELFELARMAIRPEHLVDVTAPELRLLVAPDRGVIPGMHALYRGGRCVLRATGEGRMLRAALLHLGASVPDPVGTVRLRARIMIRGGAVTLVTGTYLEILDQASPRLGRLGFQVLDVPGPLVDAETREVVVPDLPDFLDPDGFAEIDRRFPPSPSERRVTPGRYAVAHLVAVGMFGGDHLPRDREVAQDALTALLVGIDGPTGSRERIRIVERLLELVAPTWIVGLDDRELLDVLARLPE